MKKSSLIFALIACLILPTVVLVTSAHSGRTDSRGGHTNHSTGEYHYHHGYSAHDHYDIDGDGRKDCPYDFHDNTDYSVSNSVQQSPKEQRRKPQLWGLLSALVSSIIPAFAFSLLISLLLVNIFFFLFGEDKGWIVSKIVFFLTYAIVYYQLVILNLS